MKLVVIHECNSVQIAKYTNVKVVKSYTDINFVCNKMENANY